MFSFQDFLKMIVKLHGKNGILRRCCREALCSSLVLDELERVDWRACTQSRDEEINATNRFRQFFKSFDFTLSDDEDN